VTDDNLLRSPYVRKLNLFHDIEVHRGEEDKINFLLQTPLTKNQAENLNVIYDPLNISVKDVEVKSFKNQSLVSITLIPKEVGSHKIGLAFPQSKLAHREKLSHLASPLTSIPCNKIHSDRLQESVKVPAIQ
jgi:hypothetical protein